MWPSAVISREEAFELEDAIQKLIEVTEEQKRKWQYLSLLGGGQTSGLGVATMDRPWNSRVEEYHRDIEHFANLLNKAIRETKEEEERKKGKEAELYKRKTSC